jgi:radical SAM protein with 4Fe4S-binding SPASM domain
MSEREPGQDQGVFAFPRKVQIQTVDACNFRCPACPYPLRLGGPARPRMDPSLLDGIIAETRAAGRTIKLCLMLQNEPLLDRRFLQLLSQAHEAEDAVESIASVTNGSTLTEALLDRLVAYERFNLTVSVNANDRQRYLEVHGVDLWEDLERLLSRWRGRRQRVRLSFIVEGGALDEGRAFLRRWQGCGYRTRLVPIMSRAGLVSLGPGRRLVQDDFGHCHYPVDTLNVLADGEVILCCNDWSHQETLGNLRASSIREIWNTERYRELRTAAIDGRIRETGASCAGCDYPMRSTVRMELEAMAGAADVLLSHDGTTVEHQSEIRLDGDERPWPVTVVGLDATAGTISCAIAGSPPALEPGRTVWFRLSIAHGEIFSFGTLAAMWCPCRLTGVSQVSAGDGPLSLLELRPDPTAEMSRLFPWYAADWSLARGGTAAPAAQGG